MTENYNGGNMKHLYKVKNLKKTFGRGEGKTDVLKGIDFKIRKGEIVTILGPSGSGKSTLLHILGGLDTADDGTAAEDQAEETATYDDQETSGEEIVTEGIYD